MPGKKNREVTQEERDEVRRLYEEHYLAPVEIAPRVRRTPVTVTSWLKEMGHIDVKMNVRPVPFISDKQQRLAFKRKLQKHADECIERCYKPYKAWSFGGKDNTWNWAWADPQPRDIADFTRSAALAIDQAMKIDAYDSEDGAAQVKSMLAGVMVQFGLYAQHYGGASAAELTGEPAPMIIQGQVEQ